MSDPQIKIVIIDDEKDLCFLLADMLGKYGFDVDYFFNLESGLEGIGALKPQWIVIDNDLPDGSGWEKTADILNMLPGVNIINISANPDSPRTAYESGVNYLIKPINVESIVSLIRGTQQAS